MFFIGRTVEWSKGRNMAEHEAARIISYVRYSTPEQAFGQSEERQLEQAKLYASEVGLPLDETITDRGFSGYHGTHKSKGALGRLLLRVQKGEIPKGSILLVENIDRLGREQFTDAYDTIRSLIQSGIKIQTLTPRELYTMQSINNGYSIHTLVGQIVRAHEESKRKSQMLYAARERNRKDVREGKRKVLTKRCPVWLDVKDGEFKAISQAADTIKSIFDCYLNGDSLYAIEKKLNQNPAWVPPPTTKKKKGGNGWRKSYITKILKNPAVMGHFQPYTYEKQIDNNGDIIRIKKPAGKAIKDYYVPIIDEHTFYAVQNKLEQKTYLDPTSGKLKTKTGGRTGQFNNLFKHLVTCAYCGGPMRFENKGDGTKGGKKLVCDNARRNVKCQTHYIDYDECETLILDFCREIEPDKVLPNPDAQTKLCQQLSNRIEGWKATVTKLEEEKTNLRKNLRILTSDHLVKECESDLLLLEQQIEEKTKQLSADEAALQNAQIERECFAKWQRNIKTLRSKIQGNPELRMQLNSHLKDLIEEIKIYPVGLKNRDGHGCKVVKCPGLFDKSSAGVFAKSKWPAIVGKYSKFVELVESRMFNDKEARFIEVVFKNGAARQMGPKNCLSNEISLPINKDGDIVWGRVVGGAVKALWKEFERVNKQC